MKNILAAKVEPEIYYYAKRGQYYRQIANGKWVGFSQDNIRLYLKSCGMDSELYDSNKLTEIGRYLLRLHNERVVNDVISLAGYSTGLHTFGGMTVLVTDSPTFIEPKQGDFTLIDRLCSDILGTEQQQHFYAWLKVAIRNLREADYSARGQAVFLVGPAQSCKSLLQDLITKLLGGRCEKPHQYLMGTTPFNAELFGAEHLKLEDEAGKDYDERGTFTIRLKGMIANTSHNRHEKGHTPNSYSPKWRLTVSLNDDQESVKIIPIMDTGMSDKINIYKCAVPDLSDVIPSETIRNEKALMALFESQLPAFIHFLLHDFQIANELRTNRFGVRAFHNQDVLKMVNISPMVKAFHDTLTNALCLDKGLTIAYYGKAGDFVEFFKLTGTTLDSSYNGPRTFGRRLGEAAKIKELTNRIAIKNHNDNSTTYVVANDLKHPTLSEHNIKDVVEQVRDGVLRDKQYVSPLLLRQEFERWVTEHK